MAPSGSIRLTRARWLRHEKRTVPPWQAFPNGMKCRGATCEWKSMVHLQACLERWLDREWKSTVHLQAWSWEWVYLRVKVQSALASTFLRSEADLRVKFTSAFASMFLRGEVTSEWKSKVHLQARSWELVDLQVEELWSSWWTRARRHRSKLCKSGNGTSRSSSRGGGEGNLGEVLSRQQQRWDWWFWPNPGSLYTPGGWKSDNLVDSLGCGEPS